MKDAGRERRIGFAAREHIGEVRDGSRAARGDHRNADGLAHCRCKFAVKARAGSVGVHRGEENFACAALLRFAGPLDDCAANGTPTALHEYLRVAYRVRGLGIAPRVDGDDNGLRAKTRCRWR